MKKLIKAIEDGNVSKVKEILELHPNLLDSIYNGFNNRTPLLVALSYMQYEIAEYLIEKGANVNIPDDNGDRSVALAQDPRILQLLIDNGGNVNLKNNLGFTALHGWNSTEIDRVLVQNGADPNSRANEWQTPLHMACLRGESVDRIRGLVALGANIWLKDKYGNHIFNYLEDYLNSLDGRTEEGQIRAKEIEKYFDSIA